jgi:hypothetical protein
MSAYLPLLFGIIGTIIGASLTAFYNHANTNKSRKVKQKDLCRLIVAELLNLSRHCRVTAREIKKINSAGIVELRKARYRDSGFMALEAKELFILNENLCQDVMQMILISRNNDIEIDCLIDSMKSGKTENFSSAECRYLVDRLEATATLADTVTKRLKRHAANPEGYDEPHINW